MNLENTESCEFLTECVFCSCSSVTEVCKTCRDILRKYGIVNVPSKEDYENFYLWQVDEATKKAVKKDIIKSLNG